jgi:hypothetical protein
MNVGEVTFDKVPPLYVLSTSAKLADLAPPSVLEKLGVGYRALEARALESRRDPEERELFQELVKLKESERLFSVGEGEIALERGSGGAVNMSARCFLPAKTPVGEIAIKVFGFNGGEGELIGSDTIHLSFGGATAFISTLAKQHGVLYGILAVVIAIVVGLITGFVFGLGSKAGH